MYLFVELLHIETRWVIKGISSESAKIQTPESRSSKLNHSLSFLKVHINVKLIYYIAVWWMRVDNESLLSSISAFKKNSNSTQFIELYFGVSEQTKPLQPIGQAAEFKFESKFEPLPTSAGHLTNLKQSRRLFEKTIEGIDCKINGQALGAALRHSLGGSDMPLQTQGVSESAAVAAGRDQLAWGKRATTLAILT